MDFYCIFTRVGEKGKLFPTERIQISRGCPKTVACFSQRSLQWLGNDYLSIHEAQASLKDAHETLKGIMTLNLRKQLFLLCPSLWY